MLSLVEGCTHRSIEDPVVIAPIAPECIDVRPLDACRVGAHILPLPLGYMP